MNRSVEETIGRFFPYSFHTSRLDSQRTRSVVPNSVSPQAALQINPRYTTYYNHLSIAGHGTPLWLPEPNETQHINYRRQGTAIGDVVFFTDNGGLDFLFNICLDACDPINGGRVPEGFSPFKPMLQPSDVRRFHEYGEDSSLASKSIKKIKKPQGPAGLFFESSASEGAILTMPEGAHSEDLARVSGFHRYLADNLDSWYQYVNEVREWGVEQGQLHLVTGVHKAKAWGIATFSNERMKAMELNMVFKCHHNTPSGDLYSWEYEGTVDSTRVGPSREQRNAVFEGSEEAERQPFENQCLFVRTVNAMIQKPQGIKNRKSNSVVISPSQVKTNTNLEPSTSSARPNYTSSQGGTNEIHGTSALGQLGTQDDLSVARNGPVLRDHPSKAINNFLLKEKPNGRIAITHDQDWISLLTKEDVSLPSGDELVARLKNSCKIIENEGVISLEYKGPHSDITAGSPERLLAHDHFAPDNGFGEHKDQLPEYDTGGTNAVLSHVRHASSTLPINATKKIKEVAVRGHKAVAKPHPETEDNVNALRGMEPTIILIGQTGVGKSQFIRVAGGISLNDRGAPRVGHGVTSETETVEVFRAENPNQPGNSVRLIDTPGFNDSDGKGDDVVIRKIIEWLKKEPTARIQGVLYMHEITQIRSIHPGIVKPKDIPQPPGIFIVTTKWSSAQKLAEEARREAELGKELKFPPKSMHRFQNTSQSAWDIIAAVRALPANVTQQELAEGLGRIYPQFHIKQQTKSFAKTLANMFRNMFK